MDAQLETLATDCQAGSRRGRVIPDSYSENGLMAFKAVMVATPGIQLLGDLRWGITVYCHPTNTQVLQPDL